MIKVQPSRLYSGALCEKCTYATRATGSRNEEILKCQIFPRINFIVTSCNNFIDKALPSIHAMVDIAWTIRTDVSKNL